MRYLILFICFLFSTSFAQFTEFHPELKWLTIKGKYVDVHYHEGTERTAITIAKIADEIWEPITSLYQYEPDRVHYVVKDIDDYSNGATYFFDNKIEIWASSLDFDLRGSHNWLRNVISHEFTHMVQIQAALKSSRTIPAIFLQGMSYEDERRPDILYGFPNVIVSYPLAAINVPAWFAEGTAQYMRKEFDYERWDSHRDMILRSYVLDNNMLTWNQMGVFGKTSLGNESVYNSGYALTKYIAQKYGEDKLRKITKALGNTFTFTIDNAFKDILGKSGNEIYNEWKVFLQQDYKKRTEKVLSNLVQGNIVGKEGFGNFYPIENNNKIYFISNQGADYFGLSSIVEHDPATKKEKVIVPGIRSTFSFIPGTDKIIYSKITDDNKNMYNVHDLFVYDISEEDEERLTYNLRANQPNVSPDGQKIVFLYQKDGTVNLGLVDIDGKNFKALTSFNNGEQIYNPKFSNDNSYIVFDYSYHHNRDIAKVSVQGNDFEFVLNTPDDERNPFIDKDGSLYYAADYHGIYNIYKYDVKSGKRTQMTNTTGGAFMPFVTIENDIIYSGYGSAGYKIYELESSAFRSINEDDNYVRKDDPPLEVNIPNGDISNYDVNALKNFNDNGDEKYEATGYKGVFSKLTYFPYIRYDNYNPQNKWFEKLKPGLLISSSDMLNRYSLFAGGSINTRMERDLFLTLEYKNKLPLFFSLGLKPELTLELFNITRKANVDLFWGGDTLSSGDVNYDFKTPTDVDYSLFEVDFAAAHKLFARNSNIEFRYIFSRYSALLNSFILQTEDGPLLYPSTNDVYLIGSNFQVKYRWELPIPYIDDDINFLGNRLELQYNYENNRFNNEGNYAEENGMLIPQYNKYNFNRFELNTTSAFNPWLNHSLTAKLRAGTIIGPVVPDFFDFYLGGLLGMKAYPFYAISGNEIAWLNVTYRFPVFREIDARIGHLYIDKLFMSVYGDIGNAWNGKQVKLNDFKKGVGAELRLQMNSFYLFPTSLFINAAYGLDKFSREVRGEVITYGKEIRLYGGILFGFDF